MRQATLGRTRARNLETITNLPIGKLGVTNFFFGLQVWGDQAFMTRVAQSLLLLKMSAPSDFAMITNYLGGIRQGGRSGVNHRVKAPVISLSDKSAAPSLSWCASAIAHEAYHVKLYQDDHTAYKGFKRSVQSEGYVIKYQKKVLRRVGGTAYELDYIDTVKYDHFDTNGDGKYTIEDWEMRDW